MTKIPKTDYPAGALSWIVDYGCTSHITFDKSMLLTYEEMTGKFWYGY